MKTALSLQPTYCMMAMNHTAEKSLGWRIPLQVLLGSTVDISILLCYLFYDVVYWIRPKGAQVDGKKYNRTIGSEQSNEVRGRFVGFSWDVGNAMTFKVLADKPRKLYDISRLRLGKDGENNLKLDAATGDKMDRIYILSKRAQEKDLQLPTIDVAKTPFELEYENGEKYSAAEITVPEEYRPKKTKVTMAKQTPQPHPTAVKDSTPTVETVEEDDEHFPSNSVRQLPDPPPEFEPIEMFDGDSDDPSENGEQDGHSPYDDPPLRDLPEVVADDGEDVAEHLQGIRNPGDDNPSGFPLRLDPWDMETPNPTISNLEPDEMIDRTFLLPPDVEGGRVRAKIIEIVDDYKSKMVDHLTDDEKKLHTRFRCIVNNEYDEIVAYSDICDYIEQDQTFDGIYKFREILDHKKVKRSDRDWKGNAINVLVEWESGERTWEPLFTSDKTGIADSDPVVAGIYARKHNLLGTPGWKSKKLMQTAKTQKRIIRNANQAKLHSFRTKPIFMYGFQVPRNHQQAMDLDDGNKNTKWRDAEMLELGQIDEYDTFKDMGTNWKAPAGYKKITVHFVYACKHDGRHKAR